MAEGDALPMIRQEPSPRNRMLLTRLDRGGLRWRDLAARDEAGQATVFGKGGKTRGAALRLDVERAGGPTGRVGAGCAGASITEGRGSRTERSPPGREGSVARAGLPPAASAHWLRHAHASHALDRGTPIHLGQATLAHAPVATTGLYLHARPSESSARFLGV